jgi:hypothetical protein
MVPLRLVAEAMGVTVDWVGATSTVLINGGQLSLTIGEDLGVDADGASLGTAQLVNHSTYVPARFVIEALGASVAWNEATSTVTITNTN